MPNPKPQNLGRLPAHITEETFFSVKALCKEMGKADIGPSRAQMFRNLIRWGLPHLKLKKVGYQVQLANGTGFRRMTLILPKRHIETIRDQCRLGYSVNWTVEKILRLGFYELEQRLASKEAEPQEEAVHE